MRIVFLNRFYWPDEPATAQLLTDLAEALAARDDEVVVIASHPGGPEIPADAVHRGVRIIRIAGTRWAKRLGLVGKAIDLAAFLFGALWRLLVVARRNDAVVALTDPPLLGAGAWLVAGLRGARLFHWAQDIYPEVAVALTGHRWLNILRPFRNLAWRRATRCVTLGTDMAGVLADAGVAPEKISLAPNWAPAGLSPQSPRAADALRAEWDLAGKFIVAYSGNLGRVHDLESVLAVAEALRSEPGIAFVFIGGGAQRAALEATAKRLGLPNVHFHPPQPRARLLAALALGDVHLVTLLPGCEHYVYPSKLVGVAAIGRPVIFIGPRDCEIARLVAAPGKDFGRAFERTDTAAVAAELRALSVNSAECARLAAAALQFASAVGGAEAAATVWHAWLAEPARDLH